MVDTFEKEVETHKGYRELTRTLWPLIRPHQKRLFLGVLLILAATVIDVVLPLLTGQVVDQVTDHRALADIYRTCALFGVLILAGFAFTAGKGFLIQATGQRIQHDLRSALFKRIVRFPVEYYDRNPVGRPLTRIVNDVKTLGEVFSASLSVIVLDVLVILGTLATMFYLHWKLAFAVLFIFPLVVYSIHWFSGKLQGAYRSARFFLSEINAFLGENIGGIATIQRLGAQQTRLRSFSKIVGKHYEAQMGTLRLFAYIQPLANFYNGVSTAMLVGLGGYWAIKGEVTLGLLVTFYGYIRNIYQPVRDLVEKYNLLLSAKISAERIDALLTAPVETEESDFVERLDPSPRPLEISFRDVCFRYPTRDRAAVHHLDLHVPAGRSLAIVGPTGSGKSTLVRLLLRFYEATSGEIQLGGKSIFDWPKSELRSNIGMVHQEIYLIRGTVRENLALGRGGFSDEYLIEKCKAAQAWDFLQKREGLDTVIFEGGTNLSLGERQLLSFARILAFNPPVLVLDEATAHIDRGVEKKLMLAIEALLQGRTSIVIAHRLSTIERCDQIVVMENGRVIQRGNYTELSRSEGKFRTFHEISVRSHSAGLSPA